MDDYYQFTTTTIGYKDITLSWSQASSNTGPRDFSLSYSLNGGTSFDIFDTYAVLANASPNPVWTAATPQPIYGLSFDLSAVVGLNNAASVLFRLVDSSTVSANGGTVASTGTNRVDDFIISGTAIVDSAVPEASTLLVWSLLCGTVLVASKRRRDFA